MRSVLCGEKSSALTVLLQHIKVTSEAAPLAFPSLMLWPIASHAAGLVDDVQTEFLFGKAIFKAQPCWGGLMSDEVERRDIWACCHVGNDGWHAMITGLVIISTVVVLQNSYKEDERKSNFAQVLVIQGNTKTKRRKKFTMIQMYMNKITHSDAFPQKCVHRFFFTFL